jgi:hypothetical protein
MDGDGTVGNGGWDTWCGGEKKQARYILNSRKNVDTYFRLSGKNAGAKQSNERGKLHRVALGTEVFRKLVFLMLINL